MVSLINYGFEIDISGARLTSPPRYRGGVRPPFKLSDIHINSYLTTLLGLAIIKELVNTHQKKLLPDTASELENTRWAGGGGGRRGRAWPKQVVSPNPMTVFLPQIQTTRSARPPKTLNDSYITAQGVNHPWGDNKMQNYNYLCFLLRALLRTNNHVAEWWGETLWDWCRAWEPITRLW